MAQIELVNVEYDQLRESKKPSASINDVLLTIGTLRLAFQFILANPVGSMECVANSCAHSPTPRILHCPHCDATLSTTRHSIAVPVRVRVFPFRLRIGVVCPTCQSSSSVGFYCNLAHCHPGRIWRRAYREPPIIAQILSIAGGN